MRLLPFEKVTIETSLSKEETLAELIKSIDQDRYPKPWRKGIPGNSRATSDGMSSGSAE